MTSPAELCEHGRWVLLHHRFDDPESLAESDSSSCSEDSRLERRNHWDWMFEGTSGELLTWALDRWPDPIEQLAWQLPLHRAAYLEYEGPVSNHRGSVKRHASGTYRLSGTEPLIQLRLTVEYLADSAQPLPSELCCLLRKCELPPKWFVRIAQPAD